MFLLPANRKLKRAERQLLLARTARRDAMAALADALAEERRSASLAARSRDLAKGYGAQRGAQTGEALSHQTLFAGELASLARNADQARGDASRQAAWQTDALAQTKQRIERLDERAQAARREQRHARERVDQPIPAAMARKLQSPPAKTAPDTN